MLMRSCHENSQFMTHMQMCMTEVGHVTQHDTCRVRDEMSVVGPGLGGLRDGSRTEGRTSHNRHLGHEYRELCKRLTAFQLLFQVYRH